jgi:AraC-like DNA-binding protein
MPKGPDKNRQTENPVDLVKRYIERNAMSPTLDAKAIAEKFQLSRTTLYRLFEAEGGIASHIRRVRLEWAYRELTRTSADAARIQKIAYGAGFRSLATFHRLFLETYGVSPLKAKVRDRSQADGRDEPSDAAESAAPAARDEGQNVEPGLSAQASDAHPPMASEHASCPSLRTESGPPALYS